ncbi:hypothetical protein [Bradyrhizobium sp. LeoA1S1]
MATVAVISFGTPRGVFTAGIGSVRTRENIAALPAVSTNSAVGDEVAIVGNNSTTAAIAVAFGPAPDGTATSATASTSAGFALGPGEVRTILVRTGDKVAVAALP